MEKIVKLGYKDLTFNTLYFVFVKEYNIFAVARLDKEKVKERLKQLLTYYYPRISMLNGQIQQQNIISSCYIDKDTYRIVEMPQKELKVLLLKNKLSGNLTFSIIQEKEFDKAFDENYPKLINMLRNICGINL